MAKEGVMDGPTLSVATSFYRPFLDGGYKSMITGLMNAGCFDDLMEHAILLIVAKGIILFYFILFYFIFHNFFG